MTWSAPMTAVSNTALTAAQWNTYVRDNFLETAPAKATTTGQMIVTTGANAVAARTPASNSITTSQNLTDASTYLDLTTVGPSVTVTTGTAAIVSINCRLSNGTANFQNFASWAVSGSTTIAASNANAIIHYNTSASGDAIQRFGITQLQSGLNPGSNTFTMKYHVTGGTGHFMDRNITVIPL